MRSWWGSRRRGLLLVLLSGAALFGVACEPAEYDRERWYTATNDTGFGVLTSDVWRGAYRTSGNTYLWDYQVAARIGGRQTVVEIKSIWTVGASLKNGASLSVSGGKTEVGFGNSSSWTNVYIQKYWSNTNGAREASYRANFSVGPTRDYRSNTITTSNLAWVKLRNVGQTFEITAAV